MNFSIVSLVVLLAAPAVFFATLSNAQIPCGYNTDCSVCGASSACCSYAGNNQYCSSSSSCWSSYCSTSTVQYCYNGGSACASCPSGWNGASQCCTAYMTLYGGYGKTAVYTCDNGDNCGSYCTVGTITGISG